MKFIGNFKMPSSSFYRVLIIFSLFCCFGVAITVEDVVAEDFKLSPPEKKEIIVEEVYQFYVRNYDPPYRIEPLSDPKDANYDTPESTTIAHISAMLSLNWEWFILLWTEESQKTIRKMKMKPSNVIKLWEKRMYGGVAELLQRVDRGQYVIIKFRIFFEQKNKATQKSTVVLKNENGIWKTTHLAGDPVHGSWHRTDKKYRERKIKVVTPEPHGVLK